MQTNHQSNGVRDQTILSELERLAAHFPWDRVDLWVTREPEGTVRFTSYIQDNRQFGWECVFGRGDCPASAVDHAISQVPEGVRDPEKCRERKIRELEETIAKLRSVEIGLPPYRPNRELAESNRTVEVQVQKFTILE